MKTSGIALGTVLVVGVGIVIESRDLRVLDVTHWHEHRFSFFEAQPSPSCGVAASGAMNTARNQITHAGDDASGGGLWLRG